MRVRSPNGWAAGPTLPTGRLLRAKSPQSWLVYRARNELNRAARCGAAPRPYLTIGSRAPGDSAYAFESKVRANWSAPCLGRPVADMAFEAREANQARPPRPSLATLLQNRSPRGSLWSG